MILDKKLKDSGITMVRPNDILEIDSFIGTYWNANLHCWNANLAWDSKVNVDVDLHLFYQTVKPDYECEPIYTVNKNKIYGYPCVMLINGTLCLNQKETIIIDNIRQLKRIIIAANLVSKDVKSVHGILQILLSKDSNTISRDSLELPFKLNSKNKWCVIAAIDTLETLRIQNKGDLLTEINTTDSQLWELKELPKTMMWERFKESFYD